jgi:ferrous iron transport protein B
VRYPDQLQELRDRWIPLLEAVRPQLQIDAHYAALRLVEGDPWVQELVDRTDAISADERAAARREVQHHLEQDLDIVVAEARYGLIQQIGNVAVQRSSSRETRTERIDRVVMNRFLGLPIFLAAMYLVFWSTVAIGGAFIDFFDITVGAFTVDGVRVLLEQIQAPEWVAAILADGVGVGLQTVATFIPIIFMMFLMLSLLEDSGYMARAAFVMDRLMRWVGLPGKSFVPLLVGFGCTVPAISASRTLESRKDRFMTIFMAPFMSCGARLPVYALFAAALFPARSGGVVFSLYLVGLVLAILTGLLLKHTIFHGAYSHFVMELPPYHLPRIGAVLRLAGRRLRVFVIRAGVTITVVVAILAVLNSFGTDGTFGNEDSERSVLALIGQSITPVFHPMGITRENWPATVGLFTGMFAKEAIVGTLSSLYSQNEDAHEEEFDLLESLREGFASIPANLSGLWDALRDPLGTGIVSDPSALEDFGVDEGLFGRMRSRFNPAAGYAYLLFILIYFPCVAGAGGGNPGDGYGLRTVAGRVPHGSGVVGGSAVLSVRFGNDDRHCGGRTGAAGPDGRGLPRASRRV